MYSRLRFALGYVLSASLAVGLCGSAAAQTKPEGEMRWALYVTLPSVWFDPGEVSGQRRSGCCTPFTTHW